MLRACDGLSLEGGAIELDLFLRDGDGLTYTPGGISVIRGLVYSDERAGPNELLH